MDFIYDKISEILKSGKTAALCTIVSTKGSTPLKIGAKMIVFEDGKIYGSIGGGKLEKATIDEALEILKSKKAELLRRNLATDYGMSCGGNVEIFIEPIGQKKKLFIFGAGHVGKAVAKHSLDLDFDITVIDSRTEIFNEYTFSGFNKVTGPFTEALTKLNFDEDSYIVITTFEHATDREILAHSIKKPFAYIGMIASKNKVALTRKMFIEEGKATNEELDKVDMPMGMDISAMSADEIAISIVAKLISVKNNKPALQ